MNADYKDLRNSHEKIKFKKFLSVKIRVLLIYVITPWQCTYLWIDVCKLFSKFSNSLNRKPLE
ncbi:MAG: hypothetical protein MAG551_02263 [Candidatus Scalindua arabica]|uniref:Uncharacterized protein n=1 Tax=Candidatus Scalindua arabica TaxID=1127984 RepID=A0A941W636_9BACT|nr:hypothetical protein [Candidatus Scalindua arabica]